MDALLVAAQFVAVFAAAFLAFGLENLRERRRTARWVREHLRHLRDLLYPQTAHTETARDELAAQLAAIDAWLAAREPADLTEQQWQAAGTSMRSMTMDLGSLLRSEAVTVLPHDLALGLARLEQAMRLMEMLAGSVQEARREVLPAWHERRAPLSEADASRVRALRAVVTEVVENSERAFAVVGDMVAALERWR